MNRRRLRRRQTYIHSTAFEYRFHQVTWILNIVTLFTFPAQLNDWKQNLETPTRKRRSTSEIFTDLMDFDGSGDELFEENLVVLCSKILTKLENRIRKVAY